MSNYNKYCGEIIIDKRYFIIDYNNSFIFYFLFFYERISISLTFLHKISRFFQVQVNNAFSIRKDKKTSCFLGYFDIFL